MHLQAINAGRLLCLLLQVRVKRMRGPLLALNATMEVPQKKNGEMSSSRAASWPAAPLLLPADINAALTLLKLSDGPARATSAQSLYAMAVVGLSLAMQKKVAMPVHYATCSICTCSCFKNLWWRLLKLCQIHIAGIAITHFRSSI